MTSIKSKLKTALCLSVLTLVPIHSMAQDTDEFSLDAPGATTGVGIMPLGKSIGRQASHTNGTEETVRMSVHGLLTRQCSAMD